MLEGRERLLGWRSLVQGAAAKFEEALDEELEREKWRRQGGEQGSRGCFTNTFVVY